jgi:glycerol kinase
VSFILAIDQGTTNTKALLVNREGQPVHRAGAPLRLLHPSPDFVEQDPRAILASVDTVIADCLAFSNRIAAIAISNQRETVLAWDRKTGQPIANAITWQCRRATAICDKLRRDGHESLLRERTGLGIDPLFSAAKLSWLLENIPDLLDRANGGEICFGTIDSWLLFHLTGSRHHLPAVHMTDHSNAARTQLLNLSTQTWDADLLALFNIPAAALPKLHSSSGHFADCTFPTLSGVPILSAIGDSHAALAGHGATKPGTIKATYGTGSSLMTLTAAPSPDQASHLSQTIAWSTPSTVNFALEGNISMTGSALHWLGDFLNLANPVEDAAALAASVPSSAGVHFVPAMSGLGAPHWDTAARGTITGLSRTSTRAHLVRAALEAIAFQIRDVFDAMQRESGTLLLALHADGGATRNSALMQFQADILGKPVHRSCTEDLSALGSARLAGLALGWWPALDTIPHPATTTFTPRMSATERESRYAAWQHAVAQTCLQHVSNRRPLA